MELSYSFHISSKKNAVTNLNKLNGVSKHNLRKYENYYNGYDENKIKILHSEIGLDKNGKANIVEDVKEIYKKEFSEAVKKYNEKQSRDDRKIKNYFSKVSDDTKKDLAVEIIIQVGDKEFWQKRNFNTDFSNGFYKSQIEALKDVVPDFKIANAVIHFDETSPHMHVVGVPVATGFKTGLEKQCAKTKVFTKDSLEEIQKQMHEHAENYVKRWYTEKKIETEWGTETVKDNYKIKPIAQGRNKDFTSEELKRKEKAEKEIKKLNKEIERQKIIIKQNEDEIERSKEKIKEVKDKLSSLLYYAPQKIVDLFEHFRKAWKKQYKQDEYIYSLNEAREIEFENGEKEIDKDLNYISELMTGTLTDGMTECIAEEIMNRTEIEVENEIREEDEERSGRSGFSR